LVDALLMVKCVNEDIFTFMALGKLLKTFNSADLVVKAGSKDKSLIVEGLAVVEADGVVVRVDLCSGDSEFGLRPVVNLRLDTA